MRYRRDYTQGATYFFTVITFQRTPWFAQAAAVKALRHAVRAEMARHPFIIDAIVIMPDHLHAIWTLPDTDTNYSTRWRNIKRAFTATIPPEQRPTAISSRLHKQEQAIWQRRFWEHRIRDDQDFRHHVDYIHFNPVHHHYVHRATDWPYSSIHRYIRQGTLPADWGSATIQLPDGIGHE
ncbi:REP-associated tyrosine transposase [Marichromatium bheemlicum]|uniref:Transposase n=1 Tax=Marichromatium bheemlicum TaxID=365339 RepID=A0ABX1I5N5_9GAMM|nr:transposase [Marichromatium bheemlicum]NKN32893.1 transposase [Marichromatium bheemlicum]